MLPRKLFSRWGAGKSITFQLWLCPIVPVEKGRSIFSKWKDTSAGTWSCSMLQVKHFSCLLDPIAFVLYLFLHIYMCMYMVCMHVFVFCVGARVCICADACAHMCMHKAELTSVVFLDPHSLVCILRQGHSLNQNTLVWPIQQARFLWESPASASHVLGL